MTRRVKVPNRKGWPPLQLTLIELKKADRLRTGSGPLGDWISFFERWREEKRMSEIEHAPIREALNRVRRLSANEEARRLTFVRERALHDEVSLLKEAREAGEQIGRQKGREEAARNTARNLLEIGVLSDVQIAQATGLSPSRYTHLR